MRTGSRIKNSLKNLVLMTGSLGVCLVFGEMMIRLVAPQQVIVPNHELWTPDESTGWRHVKNANTQINTGERMVHVVTDADGYRINYNTPTMSPDSADFSILVIGDSFLEAVQVENRYTIPQVLIQTLSTSHGVKVAASNTAVGGWDPNHYLVEAGQALATREYDLGIVCLYVANDIVSSKVTALSPEVVSATHPFRFPHNPSWPEIVDALLYPFNDLMETNSHLFVFLKIRSKNVRVRLGLTAEYFPQVFALADRFNPRWQTTTKICGEIAQTFSKYQTPVFFVLLPAPYQVNEKEFYRFIEIFKIDPDSVDLDQPNTILAESFRTASLPLIDPLTEMRRLAADGLDMYGNIDGHFNEEGHRVVAQIIAPIAEQYLFPPLTLPTSDSSAFQK